MVSATSFTLSRFRSEGTENVGIIKWSLNSPHRSCASVEQICHWFLHDSAVCVCVMLLEPLRDTNNLSTRDAIKTMKDFIAENRVWSRKSIAFNAMIRSDECWKKEENKEQINWIFQFDSIDCILWFFTCVNQVVRIMWHKAAFKAIL